MNIKRFYKILFLPLLILCAFITPAPSNAAGEVLINEVAWMGTVPKEGETSAQASNNEWIELFNSSSSSIDLSGWILQSTDGQPNIIIESGPDKCANTSISAGGFFLFERTDNDTISDVFADCIYTGALSNSGEVLILKNSVEEIDRVDGSDNWKIGGSIEIIGNNTTKETAQRTSSGWITASPTPRAANSSGSSTSTSTPPASSSTPSGSSGSSSQAETKILKAEAGADIFIERGKPIALSGLSSVGAESYKWYLGDGTVKDGAEITYSYQFPGTYLVTLEAGNSEKTSIDQLRVFVFGGKAFISEFFIGNSSTTGQWLEVYNPNNESLDLSGWILSAGNKNFTVPAFVIIPKGGFLVFSQQATGLDISSAGKIGVKYPSGLLVDEVDFEKNIADSSANRTPEGFFWSRELTPGRQNIVLSSGSGISDLPPATTNRVVLKSDEKPKNYISSFYSSVGNPKEQVAGASAVELSGGFMRKLFSNIIFWIIAIIFFGISSSMFYFKLINKKNAHYDKSN